MSREDVSERLRDLLGGLGARIGIENTKGTGILWARWDEIVGPSVAGNAEPTSLRAGVLRVKAASPTWATELTYLAPEIRRRANEISGAELVREVRIWTGPGTVARATARGSDGDFDGYVSARSEVPSDAGPEELLGAFEKARRAWLKRRSKSR
jgi:hypothetical protein